MCSSDLQGLPRRDGRSGGVCLWDGDEAAADAAVGVGAEVKKEFLTIVYPESFSGRSVDCD